MARRSSSTARRRQKAAPSGTVYAASKAAVRSLARTFALELLPKKGRVNIVSPGPIETPLHERTGVPKEQLAAIRANVTSLVPMQRWGSSGEVAKVVLFLASDDASYVTGADIPVDGGLTTF
jgi:NAD(P)-dependent dehydrogenase (short-subunit alcohol dehydrogenase family)